MPSTFSTNKVFELQATGENSNTWGSKLNTVITQIDTCLGVQSVSVAGAADVTLTTAQARSQGLILTGLLTGNINVFVPALSAFYDVFNNTTGAFTVTVKTASGTGYLVPQLARSFLQCDATNVVPCETDFVADFGLSGTLTPAQITADQNDYAPTGIASVATLRLSTDALRNLTGIAGGRAGRIMVIHLIEGSAALALKDQNTGSATAANRFAIGGDLTLLASQSITLKYDGVTARWRLMGENPSQLPGIVPTGTILPYAGRTAPSGGWLLCNGVAFSRATYGALDAVLRPTSTITVTIASPAVVTWTAHGLNDGDPVKFTTTGALPTGITAGTTYYVKSPATNTFNIAATPQGTAIVTSGSQSGVHTAVSAPWGDGDGSTTTNTPDLRGRVPFGHDVMGNAAASRVTQAVSGIYGASLGAAGGDQNLQAHTHTPLPSAGGFITSAGTGSNGSGAGAGIDGGVSSTTTGAGASQNMPPGLVTNYIIKT